MATDKCTESDSTLSEIEALKADVSNEVKVIRNVGDFCYIVDVKRKDVDLSVKFQITGDYPSSPPHCVVRSQSLLQPEKDSIQTQLMTEASKLTGQPILRVLTEKAFSLAEPLGLQGSVDNAKQCKSVKGKKQKKRRDFVAEEVDKITKEKLPSMKTSEEVVSRILWDKSLAQDSFTIGYMDRFVGVVEKNFDSFSWEDIASVDYNTLAIPQHRIHYFKYNGVKVWDKNERLDNVFGSTGSGLTIHDVIASEEAEKASEPTDDSSEDVVISTGCEIEYDSGLTPREKYWGKKARPTHFLALRVTDGSIRDKVAKIQDDILTMEPGYDEALIPPNRLHMTLCCLGLDSQEDVRKASQVLSGLHKELSLKKPEDIVVEFEDVDHFYNNCLYAKVKPNKDLEDFVAYLRLRVKEEGLEIRDVFDFVPHMTILKLRRQTFHENRTRYFDARIYTSYKDTDFGQQKFDNIHLCSMLDEKDADGFYYCPNNIIFL